MCIRDRPDTRPTAIEGTVIGWKPGAFAASLAGPVRHAGNADVPHVQPTVLVIVRVR